jgi:predicted butyrate kinase (DUF1464 family)
MRVLGVDPGTDSFDLCGLDNNSLMFDTSVKTHLIAKDPNLLTQTIRELEPLDMILGPSGYGLPLTNIQDLSRFLFRQMFLPRRGDEDAGMGVDFHAVLNSLMKLNVKICLTPGVIHLSTVPRHRKVNRIDMGTADKLCSAALALWDHGRSHGLRYDEASFIMLELGHTFTAGLGVEGGRVVDGIGGSCAPIGYRSLGGMDGELAYLLGKFNKSTLFSGGVLSVAGNHDLSPDQLVNSTEEAHLTALEAYLESLEKIVASLKVAVNRPREILLSGRLTRYDAFLGKVVYRLDRFGKTRRVEGFAKISKEAAQGAALLADGLMGGANSKLVDVIKLREASGSVLDHIYLKKMQGLRARFLGSKGPRK